MVAKEAIVVLDSGFRVLGLSLRNLSSLFLKALVDGADTTECGRLFQLWTILFRKAWRYLVVRQCFLTIWN